MNETDVLELRFSGYYATSSNYHCSLRNTQEDRASQLLRGGNLTTRKIDTCFNTTCVRPTIVIYI